jgi:hypothetical protein
MGRTNRLYPPEVHPTAPDREIIRSEKRGALDIRLQYRHLTQDSDPPTGPIHISQDRRKTGDGGQFPNP